MKLDKEKDNIIKPIAFYGGLLGSLLPFILFTIGVVSIALSGAPDERGFWPVLILAIGVGILLAKDRNLYCETIIDGMSQRIIMIMITAWMMASIIGVLMSVTGFVEGLIWVSEQLSLGGRGFVLATFMICCLVSLSTGSSFATILICSPLLYPSGGIIGAHLPSLAGAIIAGATFGDFIAPISDTTIASALSQKAEIGPTVRSRVKYIVPAIAIALIGYIVTAGSGSVIPVNSKINVVGNPQGLVMILVPVLIIYLFLKGKHLLYGLMMGLILGVIMGLAFGLLTPVELLSLDIENMTARSFIIDGINKAVGISFFTILLMGLVATLKASGLIKRLITYASSRIKTSLSGETWITGVTGAAVLLITHSVVAILMVAEFTNETGDRVDVHPQRRANIMSMVVCVFPFLLPYFIPVILMSSMTTSGQEYGIDAVSPLACGMYNFVAWGLLLVVIISVLFGYGRKADNASLKNNLDQHG